MTTDEAFEIVPNTTGHKLVVIHPDDRSSYHIRTIIAWVTNGHQVKPIALGAETRLFGVLDPSGIVFDPSNGVSYTSLSVFIEEKKNQPITEIEDSEPDAGDEDTYDDSENYDEP